MTLRKRLVLPLAFALAMLTGLIVVNAAMATHPHPTNTGALQQQSSLVPAFVQCLPPNASDGSHGPPLNVPSCRNAGLSGNVDDPALISDQLTTRFGGKASLLIKVICGTPASNTPPPCPAGPPDTEDVLLQGTSSDVRCKSATSVSGGKCSQANAPGTGPDYSGTMVSQSLIRISDHYNGTTASSSNSQAGTVVDLPFSVGVQCVRTPPALPGGTTIGSQCNVKTTADTIVPGSGTVVKEAKQAVVAIQQIQAFDGGPDGTSNPNPFNPGNCPPACISGAGDQLFAVEGIYIP